MPPPTREVSRGALLLVVAAAALPRLLVLAVERDQILEEFVEKSDRFAQTLVASGTFGFLPGVPSAYTQPLYAFFLAGLYWPFGHSWLAARLRPSEYRASRSWITPSSFQAGSNSVSYTHLRAHET